MAKPNARTGGPDLGESEDVEPGAVILSKNEARKVILNPDKIIVKSGPYLSLGEAAGLKVASGAGLPAPFLHGASSSNETVEIRMSYIPGQTLDKLWPSMSDEQKKDAARQVRDIVKQMRELEPPNYIGCCDGTGIRDTRVRFTYEGPICINEAQFNAYLDSSLFRQIPSALRASFNSHLKTDHRIVFTHGDLMPRNILMQDGKISGIVDWEESGWYPEYWEIVKFFERPAEFDWKEYAEIIFPELYYSELVTYTAMSKWRAG